MELTIGLTITIGFGLIIIVLFGLSWVQVRQRGSKIRAALDALPSDGPRVQQGIVAKELAAFLETRDIQLPDAELKTYENAEDYFDVDSLLAGNGTGTSGFSIGALIGMPNTLVGTGILGTFVGLTYGVAGFETSSTEAIKNSIEVLLSGMTTAFATSIAGMFFSIWLGVIERKHIDGVYRAVNRATTRLNRLYRIRPAEERRLAAANQREQASAESRRFETAVTRISDAVTAHLSTEVALPQGGTEHRTAARTLELLYAENHKQTIALEAFSSDLAGAIYDGMEKLMDPTDEASLSALLTTLTGHVEGLSQSLSSPAEDMTKQIADQLEASLGGLVQSFQNNLSGSAKSEMEGLAKELSRAGQSLSLLPDRIERMSDNLSREFERLGGSVQAASQQAAERTSGINQELATQMDAFAEFMRDRLASMSSAARTSGEQHETQLGAGRALLASFGESLQYLTAAAGDLTQLNSSSADTGHAITAAGKSLHVATERVDQTIRTLSDRIQAVEAQQSSAFAKTSELQTRLSNLLAESQTLASSTDERYSRISGELGNSITLVEKSFKDYTKYVSESSGAFLEQYGTELNRTVKELASASNNYAEIAEELTSAADKLSRRG